MIATETTARRRSFYDAVIGDLVELVKAQPHQTLISSASVAIVASEAATLVPWPFNILMAVGAEWAYLRGLASSPKGARGWVMALNWGALTLVVLYGMLWGARKFGALPDEPSGLGAWVLTAAHILPVAFLSLTAAMVHRSAVEAEAAERAAHEAEEHDRRRKLQLEDDERQRRRQERLDEIEAQCLAAMNEIEAEKQKALARLEYRQARVKIDTAEEAVKEPVSAPQSTMGRLSRAERLDRLLTLVRQSGGVASLDITATAARLGVSRQTVYNDVRALQQAGRLPSG